MPKGQYDRSQAHFRTWEARFLAKFEMGRRSVCWPWLGFVDKQTGYGRFGLAPGKVKNAHVMSHLYFWGPIQEGLDVDHVRTRGCIRRDCVNPWHLEAVTRRENLLRGDTIAARNAAKTHCVRGHSLANARVSKLGQRKCRGCDAYWNARRKPRAA